MAACAFCYATVSDGEEACPRCGRAVGARAPVADGPSLTPWTERADAPSRPSATPAPAPTPAVVEPLAGPTRPPDAPWRPPDAARSVAPPPSAPSPSPSAPSPSAPPPAAAPWTPRPGAGATGWPATPPTESLPPYAAAAPAAPIAEGPADDLDRSNAIVLLVVSAIVALGLVLIAVLASNGVGPALDEIEGAAGATSAPSTATTLVHDRELTGGR